MSHTIGIQDVEQRYDPFQLVDVGAIHDWQKVELICPHALQCQVKTLVGMDVRKCERIHQFFEFPAETEVVDPKDLLSRTAA